ncbi:DUF2163 domain-containing protein [Celeribacter indicus]|uniref:Bacteriophage phiJL001 Gp84 C-terminal domain-containing protein n=1 Tax=Celeribacter indicus TaxID=1208324 RepID=A0A0B5DZ00_9RHOB|nr:DUF2163 domain-containing protein [Celeribacter indicus]AJE46410.1 hypothetical protein P73_1695 [Celeribacter indicus]SDW55961.1 phage conserved hypothetical protein BR0599 [Celeribacter indicus]
MGLPADLQAHLDSGTTTLCRTWAVVRRDGESYGFTDHDRDLAFDGVTFRADTGLTAHALEQATGLSVDNTEALGALSSAAVSEADIRAGRFDGARVRAWLVNWTDVRQRVRLFDGTFGEITRAGGSFRAELRGLTEALNQPQGRVYQPGCSAILGGRGCGVDLGRPGYSAEVAVEKVGKRKIFRFARLDGFEPRWFERGRLTVLGGAAAGLAGIVKTDRLSAGERVIELWEDLRAEIAPGDPVRIEAGCDRRAETCRLKFDNFLNYRGFPHIPGDDWLARYPLRGGANGGGSLVAGSGG